MIVTMTFDETSITDVVLDVSGETAAIGQVAAEDLKTALMAAQGAEIDAVGGATVTSNAVMEAANKCIQQAKGEILHIPLGWPHLSGVLAAPLRSFSHTSPGVEPHLFS